MEQREYLLPQPTHLQFFRDSQNFAEKAWDHFLNEQEPWDRLLGAKFVRQTRTKIHHGDASALRKLYAEVTRVVDEAIQFAVEMPVFARVDSVSNQKTGRQYHTSGFWFIGRPGFVVIAHGGVIRTAYFTTKNPSASNYTLFKEAWSSVRAKLLATGYFDRKGRRDVEHQTVVLFNEMTWRSCPNPHGKPRRRRRLPDPLAEWMEDLERLTSLQPTPDETGTS